MPYTDMNQPWVDMCPPSWAPTSSLPHPSGSSQCTSVSALFHASNPDWWSISHMVIDMFQSCFLKPSHPRLLLTASLKQSSFASTCSAQSLSNPVLWHSQPCSLPFQTYHITWVTRQPHWDPHHLFPFLRLFLHLELFSSYFLIKAHPFLHCIFFFYNMLQGLSISRAQTLCNIVCQLYLWSVMCVYLSSFIGQEGTWRREWV